MGEAVVVVVAEDMVGRMAPRGELVGWVVVVVDVVDEGEGEAVTVEVVDVVAVEVEVEVRGEAGMALGVVEVLVVEDVEDVEVLEGDSVTVGSTVRTTVFPITP